MLPELPKKLNVEEAEKARDKVQEAYTEQRQTRSSSKPLQVGQRVWLQDQQSKKWDIEGVIKSVRNGGRLCGGNYKRGCLPEKQTLHQGGSTHGKWSGGCTEENGVPTGTSNQEEGNLQETGYLQESRDHLNGLATSTMNGAWLSYPRCADIC